MVNKVHQLGLQDELWLRRRMLRHDPVFAMHRQLKDYFLQPTDRFGVVSVYASTACDPLLLVFWSRTERHAYIHSLMGDVTVVAEAVSWLERPCQMYVQDHQREAFSRVAGAEWHTVLEVFPGKMVDHPAYEGVFSRVAPRFPGTVYENTGVCGTGERE